MELEAANEPKEYAKSKAGPILEPVLAANPIELLIYIGIPLCFLVVGLMFLLICLFKKYPKVKAILTKIKDSVLMGAVIKAYTMGYLGMILSSGLSEVLFGDV